MAARPETPQDAARAWVRRLVVDSDLEAAWPATDPDFRLCLTQAWVWANRTKPPLTNMDHQRLAEALAEPAPAHSLWPTFADVTLAELRSVFAFDPDVWDVSDRSRPVVPDYEWVFYAPGTIEPEETETILIVLLHRTADAWRVANLGDTSPPNPSWPPRPPEWKPVIELD